jgi:beta-glucosidase
MPRRAIALATCAAAFGALGAAWEPAAQADGRCGPVAQRPWCNTALSPDARAVLLLGAMTQAEKISLLGGDDFWGGVGPGPGATGHTGYSRGVARVGLPDEYFTDGPLGPRQGKATALPSPMSLAATFDPGLAFAHGSVVGLESRAKGNDAVFGPTVNIMRTPLGGRTFEAYGEDPFLDSRMTVGWIDGLQSQGEMATVKHYVANNQEGQDPTGQAGTPGFPFSVGVNGTRYLVDEHIDDRSLHEIYLPQFEAAVRQAHTATLMCAYNQVNDQFSCENQHLIQDILRRSWGFSGEVVADYGAAHPNGTAASLNAGLDFEAWPPWSYQPVQVQAAMASGLVSSDTLDQRVREILRTLFAFKFFDRATYRDDDGQINQAADAAVAQRVEESGITLLRNTGVLPLRASRLRSIAVIGKAATTFVTGGGSGGVTPFSFTTPLDAIRSRAGHRVQVTYSDGSDPAAAAAAAHNADIAIVFANDYDTEGSDRQCLTLECPNVNGDQDGLIQQVAQANRRTIVVLETGGPDLTPWRGQVAGLLEAWYPGERGGAAIARTLFGDVDPSGRLPVTFPAQAGDIPTAGDPSQYPGVADIVYYKEGVFVGYRWYDQQRLAPAFPFGFGLSYTRFRYSSIRVRRAPPGTRAPDGQPARFVVSGGVRNLGRRAGTAVPELYVGLPSSSSIPEPPVQLKGFARVRLAPGATKRFTIALDARDFSYWDTTAQNWRLVRGCYTVWLGASSRDLPVSMKIGWSDARCGRT